jgi:polar amino acid transport system substrate-binding protein
MLMSRQISIALMVVLLASCVSSPGDINTQSQIQGSLSQATRISRPTIHITNGEWVPYTGKQLNGYGCDSRVVSEVFSQMGYSVEYGFFPWARAMNLAETSEWDGSLEWDDIPKFQEKFYINSNPISEQEWVFFYRKDHPFKWKSLDELEGKVIGITRSYVYSDVFKSRIEEGKLTIVEASSDEANFKKLLAGRIDVFPMERNVGLALLKNHFTAVERDQITHDSETLITFTPRLLLTKTNQQNSQIMEQFDINFDRFKKSPEYTEIMKDCLLAPE